MKQSPNKIIQAPLATDPLGQINTGSFNPNAQMAAQGIYGSEYDRTMAMPSRGLTPEQVMANTPLSMMDSPLNKALVGNQDQLPQELQDAIEKA
tara:strand:+ start:61 stop:342 length:282 start_codon:yes stop_codon:yes gene_type:complete